MATSSSPPRRRFLPQPVESSTRSSKRQHIEDDTSVGPLETDVKGDNVATNTKPKRFLPQPIEETIRSSRKKNADQEKDTEPVETTTRTARRKFAVEPVETTTRSSKEEKSKSETAPRRKFAVEPVETSTRSSKEEKAKSENAPRKKFAVEPVETTTRSSKDKEDKDTSSARPRRRFAPEPVETTTVRRRRNDNDDGSDDTPPDSPSESSSRVSSRQSTGSRRFSPELIETAKGSFRHKKDPDSPRNSKHDQSTSPTISRTATQSPEPVEEPDPCASRFSVAALQKRNHEEHRRHSYCVPNLPIIESDSEEEPGTPDLTESPSTDYETHQLEKIEEDGRESFTDYVLNLTNTHERKQFHEQMMAAYVNATPHEPVAHFAADESDEEDVGELSGSNGADPKTFRRSSQAEHDYEMQAMRKHHEQLERAKKELQEDTAGASRFSAAALASRHHLGQTHKAKQKDEDAEYARMKQAASPPMLGEDIVFPFTISPKMTRCDVDQAPRPRRADSDDDYMSVDSAPQQLWSAQSSSQNKAGAGLWMGMCQKAPEPSRPTTPTRSGIQTPAYEASNPFESHTPRGARTPGTKTPSRRRPYSGLHLLPMTPPRSTDSSSDEFTNSIDKKLKLEKQIEEEFTPRVITQIYNYLSLGFPTVARDFDAELSKISRVSIKELRRDDSIATGVIKGYVGAPEAEKTWEEDEDGTIRGCRRWDALRLYVREWARQSPNFTVEQTLPVVQDPGLAHPKSLRADAWGATVRKGSWAQ